MTSIKQVVSQSFW